ncbi:glycosyltransferase [Dysgonomonas sp. Marseille-P4677]|uniref:glycosyltransferase family protein n=1 Tax=Dysgonomonas sp. Marseille-P4677 TaxID=2364790 RepID=UPI001911FB9E|nr:glycosyltransferase [Dysgonomonas sp. Marseille-P4677]MBK5720512.1 glycosyltransferase [Dysgonomonas sp. Marseille-P4677]
MKILLIGEYSRAHLTLAEGLRSLGHEVLTASDGDGFKNYPRDIDLSRKSSGIIDTFTSLMSVLDKFKKFKGYDVVQLINPCFTTQNVRVNNHLYKKLRKNNKKVFMGAFGDDSYWVEACLGNKIFDYSEFFVDGKPINVDFNQRFIDKWIGTPLESFNRSLAQSVDGIAACLYEYYKAYEPYFANKVKYIPLPMNTAEIEFQPIPEEPEKVNFFIGINKVREKFKGTDVMEKALERIKEKYPDKAIVTRVESVSYDVYQQLMSQAHVVLDQLYSHTPAMNALLAMAQGKVVVGGGEPYIYELYGDTSNQPIVNVHPHEDDVFDKLEWLILNKKDIPEISRRSREFVEKNHDYVSVAKKYLDFWNK